MPQPGASAPTLVSAPAPTAPLPIHTPSMTVHSPESIGLAGARAVENALLSKGTVEDVTIRPMPMQTKPSLFPEASEPPRQEAAQPANFIPPQPERTNRLPRLPRLEDFPLPGQNELRAQRGEAPPVEHPEKRRVGLLQRLASVGLGRRDAEDEPEGHARPAPAPVRAVAPRAPEQRPLPRPVPRPAESRAADPVSDYAKRPQHQGLDPLGRQTVQNSVEDDQLEIPAFLRRQAK
jgi:cell division protein FtsZ